ncbi:MAG: protein kinase [Deltaproteobacteria bacterium]|nr:protein kinase [Deltaproteobacteria bacterium]
MEHGEAQRMDRRIGKVIGDYTITKKLAEGGMGAVYLAVNRPTGVQVVVKFMLAEFVANPTLRERFEREIRAAVRLKGKTNIVEIYACNESEGELYMTMEYLHGETLAEHVRRCGKVSVHHAFRLIAQIIAALHELHEADIIHRDLKPSNAYVVISDAEAYCVKLIDFGIVHDRQALAAGELKTQRGAMIGTPGYMAPEQYGNAGNVTPAADIFALAVIIFEMFTGELPWRAPNEFALYEKTKSETPVLPPGHHMPPGWEAILLQALRPDPSERPPLHTLLYALARAVRVDGTLPDGFEMVTRYAPKVLRNTPAEVETVRTSDPQRAASAYWALHRVTAAPSGAPTPASLSVSDGIPISAPGVPLASKVTVTAPPSHLIANEPDTTLSAVGSEVQLQSNARRARDMRRWAAAGVGAAVVLALGVWMFWIRGDASRSVVGHGESGAPPRSQFAPDAGRAPLAIVGDAAPSRDVDAVLAEKQIAADASSVDSMMVDAAPQVAVPSDAAVAHDAATSTPRPPVVVATPRVEHRTGELEVYVKPWALVWLNGRPVGQTPYHQTVPVGRYRLQIKNDDLGKEETTVVVVSADKKTTIRRAWIP